MERQILGMRQGSMSVEEYDTEFDRLSQFNSSLVPNAKSKSRRFI